MNLLKKEFLLQSLLYAFERRTKADIVAIVILTHQQNTFSAADSVGSVERRTVKRGPSCGELWKALCFADAGSRQRLITTASESGRGKEDKVKWQLLFRRFAALGTAMSLVKEVF